VAAPAVSEVQAEVEQSPAVNADETGWRQTGQMRWLWTAVTTNAAFFQAERTFRPAVIGCKCCFGTKSGAGIVRRPHADRDRDRPQARGPHTGLSWGRRAAPAPSASPRRRSCPGEPTLQGSAQKTLDTHRDTG